MIPGNAQILTCPFCGEKKEILSLVSGNTCGSVLWSDNKQISPMLPEISYIQKCPHCGKYYNRTKLEAVYGDEWSWEKGLLTFPEMKEALKQFSEQGFSDLNEEINIRLMLIHSYNDYYYRERESREVTPEDHELFSANCKWLLDKWVRDPVLKAELYREMGDMETARAIIDSSHSDDEFVSKIAAEVKKRIEENDSAVFVIS